MFRLTGQVSPHVCSEGSFPPKLQSKETSFQCYFWSATIYLGIWFLINQLSSGLFPNDLCNVGPRPASSMLWTQPSGWKHDPGRTKYVRQHLYYQGESESCLFLVPYKWFVAWLFRRTCLMSRRLLLHGIGRFSGVLLENSGSCEARR